MTPAAPHSYDTFPSHILLSVPQMALVGQMVGELRDIDSESSEVDLDIEEAPPLERKQLQLQTEKTCR